jgi:EmrB/QacA subfamily drug resistance transporter
MARHLRQRGDPDPFISDHHDGEAHHQAQHSIRRGPSPLVLAGLGLGMLLAVLDQTVVATALPRIADDLHNFSGVTWIVTACLLTSTAAIPLYGKLSDLYGRKPVYLIGLVLFIVASAFAGLAQNLGQLIALRAAQGLGGGGLNSLASATFGDLVPPRERGRYQGYVGAIFALGSVGGPLTGGILTDHFSWRWVFYINIPLGLLSLVIIATALHLPHRRGHGRVDYAGSALLVGGVTALLLATVYGGRTYAWTSDRIVGLLVGAVVLLAVFVWWERRAGSPVLPLRLFLDRTFALAVIGSGLLGIALFGAVVYLPQYYQLVLGMSPTGSGLALTPLMVASVVTAVLSGGLASRTGSYRWFPVAGSALVIVGFGLLARVGVGTSTGVVLLDTVVLGLGIGLVMQVLVLAAQNAVAYADMGTATSTPTFSRVLGAAIGTAVFGSILLRRIEEEYRAAVPPGRPAPAIGDLLRNGMNVGRLPPTVRELIAEAFARSLHTVFLWALPFTVALLVVAFLFPNRRLRETVQEAEGVALA